MKRQIVSLLVLLIALTGIITGCGGAKEEKPVAAERKSIKVGVSAGPHAEIMEVVKKIAARDGLDIQIVEFTDYMTPNIALSQGDIDVNSYQHQPWLDNQIKDRKYEFVSIAKTVIFPMGIYSKRVKNATELKEGATIAIPNDPSNSGRALAILEKGGVIKLKPGAGIKATLADIAENPKKIKIRELDAAQIPRSLDDLDAAAINTNYAIVAGLVPTKDAIILEDPDSPYANLLVVRRKDKDQPVFRKLIKAYHTPEVKQWIEEKYKGSFVPTW
ncbi:MetQ/NlpA family ABC transporter substrate-binding protein [Acetonema longum]|uniref:Lipoprotein n=1 Tax=Acetonema longum DSM 6540 TaxID=1009370 RepID=F7NQ08_9FIRM|nr:MetQ/NlpA family ABC transporter substrate-binding protein [Acetonema longum]EGO61885.1 NLPA lipoprotein family protein 1 [Acetonema longum DSM 6540]